MAPEQRGPLISIVINNFDYGRFLGEAIGSALAQEGADVEVVVVDDGSTDDSRDVIASFGSRVRPVLKANGGQASALNAGFAASRGELVLFLDADDALEPGAAAAAAAAWRPGVGKIQFRLRVVDAEGRVTGGLHPPDPLPSGDLAPAVRERGRYPSPPTSGNVYHRSVLERLMPLPEARWRTCADTYLNLLSPLLGTVVSIDRPLGRYREHGDNAWAVGALDVARLREQLTVYENAQDVLREWAGRNGAALPDDWLMRIPTHLQSRLGSLRLQPERHPYPADRRWRLAARGLAASLRNREFGVRKRLLFAAWFPLAALLPRRVAEPLIAMSFVRGARPRLVRSLLG